METGEPIKPLRWVGSSRRDVKSFPRPVRSEIGQALYAAQCGETDPAAKARKGFGGPWCRTEHVDQDQETIPLANQHYRE